jgi:hypothetical protein
VCSGRDNDYEINLGLKSLGETTVRGAMALPEATGDTKPPRITFTESDFYDFLSCYKCSEEFVSVEMFEAHMKDRHPLKYNCRLCQVDFSGNARLTDHINTEHVTWSTSTWEDRDDELSDGEIPDGDLSEGEIPGDNLLEDSGDSNEAVLRSGADNHGSAPRTEAVTCQQCQDSKHFSRRCGECRPISKNKCYTCDSTEHKKTDCPVGPAIGRSSKRMAGRLEYMHNITLAKLDDTTTPPAGSIPGAEPVRRTTTTLSLSWAPKPTFEPIPTAVVLPVGKGTPEKKRGDSTTRKKAPRQTNDHYRDLSNVPTIPVETPRPAVERIRRVKDVQKPAVVAPPGGQRCHTAKKTYEMS